MPHSQGSIPPQLIILPTKEPEFQIAKAMGKETQSEKMDNCSSNHRRKNRLCMDMLEWLVTQKVGLAKLIILTTHVPGIATSHPLTAQSANGTLNSTTLGAKKIIKRQQNTKSFPKRATFWKERSILGQIVPPTS